MPDSPSQSVARALLAARERQQQADAAPLADTLGSADDAYAVQAHVAQALHWFDGDVSVVWKSGGASRDSVLTHARLPPQAVWTSPALTGRWPLNARWIEAEIALRLGHAVDAQRATTLDRDEARGLVDAMAVSIEIVDSRWREGMQAPALLRLADLQSNGALVLGAWMPYAPPDWAAQICRVRIGQQAEVQRRGTHALGDPAWLLVDWLRHATRDGDVLPVGAVVTTGTWVGLLDAQASDLVTVEFDGIGSASVQL